jgi:copper chaperone CopZ
VIKKTFRIPDMHCPACVMRLESIEDLLPGIIQVTASYRKQQMEVEYDEALVDEAQIIAAVKKQGYQATGL